MPLTLEAIDELLATANAVPSSRRGAPWRAYVDSLLTQRSALTPPATWPPDHETAVLPVPETR